MKKKIERSIHVEHLYQSRAVALEKRGFPTPALDFTFKGNTIGANTPHYFVILPKN